MIEILKALIYGIVEGITEWLPVSSTGHLIIIEQFMKMEVSDEFLEMFRVVIQLGAIMAVLVVFWGRIWPFHMPKERPLDADFKKVSGEGILRYVYVDRIILWLKILVSCMPAIIIGLPFNDKIDEYFYNHTVVAIMLIVYGLLFIFIEKKQKKPSVMRVDDIDFRLALIIGIFQVLALIPGTSRSGATIIGSMLFGASRWAAAEYTFYLAIPVMFGASFLKLIKFGFAYSGTEVLYMGVGMITAFVVSIVAVKFLMGYVKKHDFKVFGWYRIALGVIVLIVGLLVK